jgi:hypothetical protein
LLKSAQLELYLGLNGQQLRYFDLEQQLIPTPEEVALTQEQNAQRERERSAKLAAKALGIDPDE